MDTLTSPKAERTAALGSIFGRDSLYMVLWAVQLLCAAGLTPVITRIMGIGEFGGVASALAIMQVLGVLGGFGLHTAIQRERARPGGDAAARKLLGFASAATGAFTFVALASVGWWSRPLGFEAGLGSLRITVIWAGCATVTIATLALLRSQDRLGAFCAVSLVQSVVAEAASLGCVLLVSPTAESFLEGRLWVQAAAMVLSLLLTRPRWVGASDHPMVRGALWYALPLVPAALSSFVLSTADRLIIQGMLGSDEVARYQVAYNIASAPMLLMALLQTAWLPRFFSVPDVAERRDLIGDTREMLHRLLAPAVLGLAVGAPLLIMLWAPAHYRPEKLDVVAVLIIISVIPYAAQVTRSLHLTPAGRTGSMALAVVVAAAANVALNIVLIPPLGLEGSALATLLSFPVSLLVIWIGNRKRYPVPPLSGRTRALVTVAVVLALLTTALPDTPTGLAVRAVAALGCAAAFTAELRSTRSRLRAPPPTHLPAVPADEHQTRTKGNIPCPHRCSASWSPPSSAGTCSWPRWKRSTGPRCRGRAS